MAQPHNISHLSAYDDKSNSSNQSLLLLQEFGNLLNKSLNVVEEIKMEAENLHEHSLEFSEQS